MVFKSLGTNAYDLGPNNIEIPKIKGMGHNFYRSVFGESKR